MVRKIEIIGIPSSAGANQSGIEQAPAAIRAVGLAKALRKVGCDVIDRNDDPPVWMWREDTSELTASNVEATVKYVSYTRQRVTKALAAGHLPLVIGGDCSIEIGVVAANIDAGHRIGLVYFDGHTDLNVPGSVPNGTGEFEESLDWMGIAHMLGMEGGVPALAKIGSRHPLLNPSDIAVAGFIPEQASEFECKQIQKLNIRVIDWKTLAGNPEDEITKLLETWGKEFDRLLVHFDVDVLNFTDMPIADTTASRDVGLKLHQAMKVLSVLVAEERFSGLTITEINPTHGKEEGTSTHALKTFVQKLAEVFSQFAKK